MKDIISVPIKVPHFIDGEVIVKEKKYPFCWGTGAYFASELAKKQEEREAEASGFANDYTLSVFKDEDESAVDTLKNFSDVSKMYYDGVRFGCKLTGVEFDLKPEHILDAMNDPEFANPVYEYMQQRTMDFEQKKKALQSL